MHYWDSQSFAKATLYFKAARSGDVFKIDATKARRDELHRAYDFINIIGVQSDWPGINVSEALEERSLAFHHRHRSFRSKIAKA